MKKTEKYVVLLMMILIAVFSITSCDKDNGTESGISALYGTWNLLSMHYRITVGNIVVQDTTEAPGTGEYMHVTLKEDGTYETEELYEGVKETGTGTYIVEGDSVTISDFTDAEGPQKFKWNVTGNILKLTSNMQENIEGFLSTLDIEAIFEKM